MQYEVPRCPICLVKQTEHPSLIDVPLATTYCPACGIPHFMEAAHVPERVVCQMCDRRFKPSEGGGPTLRYYLGSLIEFQTPSGIQRIVLKRGEA